MPEGWKAEFAAQTVDNPHDKGDSCWTRAQTMAVQQLFAQYSGSLGRYHGGKYAITSSNAQIKPQASVLDRSTLTLESRHSSLTHCPSPTGPSGQPHQPGDGPGFTVTSTDLRDPSFRYFGSGRARMVRVVSE